LVSIEKSQIKIWNFTHLFVTLPANSELARKGWYSITSRVRKRSVMLVWLLQSLRNLTI